MDCGDALEVSGGSGDEENDVGHSQVCSIVTKSDMMASNVCERGGGSGRGGRTKREERPERTHAEVVGEQRRPHRLAVHHLKDVCEGESVSEVWRERRGREGGGRTEGRDDGGREGDGLERQLRVRADKDWRCDELKDERDRRKDRVEQVCARERESVSEEG